MKILVVDDEKSVISTITDIFDDKEVSTFQNPELALSAITSGCEYDIVIIDYRMHKVNGIELLKEIKKCSSSYKAILLTAYSTEQVLEEGINRELFNRIIKKSFDPDDLKSTVEELYRGLLKERNEKQDYYTRLQKDLSSIIETDSKFVYASAKMKQLHNYALKIAKSNAHVLIEGESGTGKEIVAQLIHKNSSRANQQMLNINCSAIYENTFESEMFGHKKGSFTGAIADKTGKFKSADGGTIFLDEIGDMPLPQQAKLLRAIENMEISPIGGDVEYVNVRIICATNKNLPEMVEKGTFREDLYHRLNIVNITIPPLRGRREDIPLLIAFFMAEISKDEGLEKSISPDSIEYLKGQEHKGNVRELRSLLKKSFFFSSGETITLADIQQSQKGHLRVANNINPFDQNVTLAELEIQYIKYQLKKHNGILSETAPVLGMETSNLSRKLKNLGISVKDLNFEH
jgi:DNA-binding NtrC family response regulator